MNAKDAKDDGHLSAEQILAVERIVKERVEQDRQFVASVISVSAKIAGIALFAAVGFFTFLGYQTFGEIKSQIAGIIEKKVDEQLENGSTPVESLTDRLQTLHALALIDFHRGSGYVRDEPTLSIGDAQTLVESLADKDCDERLAYGSIDVLGDSRYSETLPKLESTLLALVTTPPADSVLAARPDIRARLIDVLAKTESKRAFRPLRVITGDRSAPPELRTSVIRFAERIGDRVDQATLDDAAASDDAYLRAAALRLLAAHYPDSKVLQNWFATLKGSRKDGDHLIEVVELADAVGHASRRSELDEVARKEALARNLELLQVLMRASQGRFSVSMHGGEPQLVYSTGSPFSPGIRVQVAGEMYTSPPIFESLPTLLSQQAAASSPAEFARIVRVVSPASPQGVGGRIPVPAIIPRVRITAQFEDGGNLTKGGARLLQDPVPDEVQLEAGLRRAKGKVVLELRARWQDASGLHTEAFDGFEKPQKIAFAVAIDDDDVGRGSL